MFKKWWKENRKKSDGWTTHEFKKGREVWNAAINAALDVISSGDETGCYNEVSELEDID